MSNLLRAGLCRVKKDKWLWLGIFVTAAYGIFGCISQYQAVVQYEKTRTLEDVVFLCIMIPGITLAASVSVLVGTEYSDGTIRNKIATGKKRSHIYLSTSVLCCIEALLIYLISGRLLLAMGLPLFGFFKEPLWKIGYEYLLMLLIFLVYASLYQMLAMLNQNKAYAAIICLIIGFLLLFAGSYLYQTVDSPQFYEYAEIVDGQAQMVRQENPYYVTGVRRTLYRFLLDVLPSGVTMQIVTGEIFNPVRAIAGAVCDIIIFNGIGMYFFQKKDIK